MDSVNGFLRQNGGAAPGLTSGAISPRPVTDVTVPTLYFSNCFPVFLDPNVRSHFSY